MTQSALLTFISRRPTTWFEPSELAQRGFGTRDAVRKQLERLARKGLIESEERMKPHETYRGSSRYKVYKFIQPLAVDKKGKASSAKIQLPICLGDTVRYVGSNRLITKWKGIDRLTVQGIKAGIATVSSPEWTERRKVRLSDLTLTEMSESNDHQTAIK